MGHRLSKIYTRTGDKGTTGLGDGSRIEKDSVRVEAYGTADELNSVVGMLLSYELPESVRYCLTAVQHDLFDLGGELCIPGHSVLKDEQVNELENQLDLMNEHLKPLKEFILPGGTQAAAVAHLARTVCRRAERRTITLQNESEDAVNAVVVRYLNRLSDLLFVIARYLNHCAEVGDVLWNRDRH